MQSANLSGPLKGLRPYQALLGPTQASGLAGGFDLTMQLILFAFSTIICSVQLNVQGPGGSYEIPFHQRSLGEVGHLHPPHPDSLQRGAHSRHYYDRTHLGDTGGRRETGGREDQEREIYQRCPRIINKKLQHR